MLNSKQINPATPPIMEKQTGSVPVPANSGRVYPKEVLGIIEMFFKNAAGQEIQITSNGTLMLPAIPSLLPAGGTVNQILAKQSNSNYATAWQSVGTILKEFKFVLPAGATLAARLTGLVVTGLELSTAFDHTPTEPQFGTSVDTLVLEPTGMSDIIPLEINAFEITSSGPASSQGISKIFLSDVKGNTTKTKAAFMDLGASLDAAKAYIIYVRFI